MKEAVQIVILNKNNEILAVSRKDNHEDFGLPGGKVDPEDLTLLDAIQREVKEETGIVNLEIIDFNQITFHIFKKAKKYRLKETHWYNMRSDFDGEFKPELSEGISKVKWKRRNKIENITNTFQNIKLLFEN